MANAGFFGGAFFDGGFFDGATPAPATGSYRRIQPRWIPQFVEVLLRPFEEWVDWGRVSVLGYWRRPVLPVSDVEEFSEPRISVSLAARSIADDGLTGNPRLARVVTMRGVDEADDPGAAKAERRVPLHELLGAVVLIDRSRK